MIKIREIDHIVLRTTDLNAMINFYCDVLGCKIERRQDEIGLVQLRAGSSLIDLSVDMENASSKVKVRNMEHFCLRVDPFNAEEIYSHLKQHGIEAGEVVSRYGAEGEGPSIYLKDLENNVVELKGAPYSSKD